MRATLWILAGAVLAGPVMAADAPAEPAPVTIVKGALCTAVSDREPVDPKESPAEYERSIERVYFWNSAHVAAPPQTVKHVWYWDGKQVGAVSLPLKHGRTRTWSSKTIAPGAWKVEAVSESGQVLQTFEFSVR